MIATDAVKLRGGDRVVLRSDPDRQPVRVLRVETDKKCRKIAWVTVLSPTGHATVTHNEVERAEKVRN